MKYKFWKPPYLTWSFETSVSIDGKTAAFSTFSEIYQKLISLANIFRQQATSQWQI